MALVSAGSASAAITVSSTNDAGPGSIRQAIGDAPPGETIVVPAGTYTLTSDELTIEKTLTISGHAAGDTVIRSGGPFRVFDIAGAGNSVTISGVTIRDGHAVVPSGVAEGGGIRNEKASLTLLNTVVTANRADAGGTGSGDNGGDAEGGGIYSEFGALTLEGVSVTGNAAAANGAGNGGNGGSVEGGGVASYEGSSVTIRNSVLSGNSLEATGGSGGGDGGTAEAGGAYLEIGSTTSATLSADTISDNQLDASGGAGGDGGTAEAGGMYLESSAPSLLVSNLTVSGNRARALAGAGGDDGVVEGGGLFVEPDTGDSVTLLSSTLAGNVAEAGGAGVAEGGNIYAEPGTRIANSIVSGGVAQSGTANCGGKVESQGFNIESANECGFGAAGDRVNTDPQLGPLQSNGGPVPTMAPTFSSPAIDQGSATGADARGVIRPIDFPTIPNAAGGNGSDIGAVELQPSNALALGKLKKNRKNGTATLTVTLPQPSAGNLTLHGNGLKSQTVAINGQALVKLKVAVTGKAKKALRKKGKRRVKIEVTYSPTGNAAATVTRNATLVRKHKKRKHRKHGAHKKHR
jgi:putative cofactor-binding repeat protein